ncbi:amphi-Trp domain-containing protein [Halopiger thermotolerans]
MVDNHDSDPDSDDDPDSATDFEFEFERAYDRGDLATVFRTFASALEDGAPVRIDGDEGSATVAVPPRVVAEFEAERDPEDDPPVAELGFELEWDDPDGSSVRPASEAESDDGDVVVLAGGERAHAGEGEDEEPASDSAMATIPPEGVAGTETDTAEDDREPDASAPESDRTTATESDEPTGETRSSGRTSRFEVYQDRADQWRWRLVHWNGNIVADSGEGYASRSNAKRAARSVMRTAPAARITDRDADDE